MPVLRSRRGGGGEAEVALDEGAVVAAGAAQGDERLREVVPVHSYQKIMPVLRSVLEAPFFIHDEIKMMKYYS